MRCASITVQQSCHAMLRWKMPSKRLVGGPLRRSEARIQLRQCKVVSKFINTGSFKAFPNTPCSSLSSAIKRRELKVFTLERKHLLNWLLKLAFGSTNAYISNFCPLIYYMKQYVLKTCSTKHIVNAIFLTVELRVLFLKSQNDGGKRFELVRFVLISFVNKTTIKECILHVRRKL